MKPTAQDESPPASAAPRSSLWLNLASGLIALHLFAVFVAPFSVPPSSPLAASLARFFQPYLDAAFLNHGYKFFAPDPGPSHLVRYEVFLADGKKIEGRFPNLSQQQPRLLYHRHMMLADRLDGPLGHEWSEIHARSYARHLLHMHHAERVKLYLVTHALPFPGQVLEGMKLDDASLYRERLLIELTGDAS